VTEEVALVGLPLGLIDWEMARPMAERGERRGVTLRRVIVENLGWTGEHRAELDTFLR
jgi:hypothetical protein